MRRWDLYDEYENISIELYRADAIKSVERDTLQSYQNLYRFCSRHLARHLRFCCRDSSRIVHGYRLCYKLEYSTTDLIGANLPKKITDCVLTAVLSVTVRTKARILYRDVKLP